MSLFVKTYRGNFNKIEEIWSLVKYAGEENAEVQNSNQLILSSIYNQKGRIKNKSLRFL